MKKLLIASATLLLVLVTSGCGQATEKSSNVVSLHSVVNTGVSVNGLTAAQSFHAKSHYKDLVDNYITYTTAVANLHKAELAVEKGEVSESEGEKLVASATSILADVESNLASLTTPDNIKNEDLRKEFDGVHSAFTALVANTRNEISSTGNASDVRNTTDTLSNFSVALADLSAKTK